MKASYSFAQKKSNLLIQFNTAAVSAAATAVSPGNSYVNIVSITEVYSLVVRSELNLHWNWFHHTWSWCTTIVQPINWTSLNWVGASTSDPFTLYKILWVYYEANSEVTKLLLACLCVFLFYFAHGSWLVLFQQLRFFCHNWIETSRAIAGSVADAFTHVLGRCLLWLWDKVVTLLFLAAKVVNWILEIWSCIWGWPISIEHGFTPLSCSYLSEVIACFLLWSIWEWIGVEQAFIRTWFSQDG